MLCCTTNGVTGAERADRERSWATRVLQRRTELGITQVQLAKLANITQQAVSRLERGEVTPRVSTMLAIALALGTNIEVLFPMSSAPADRVAS